MTWHVACRANLARCLPGKVRPRAGDHGLGAERPLRMRHGQELGQRKGGHRRPHGRPEVVPGYAEEPPRAGWITLISWPEKRNPKAIPYRIR